MDPFHYYAEYRVLVCKSCQYAIQPAYITAHLRSDQHKLTRQQSEEIGLQYKLMDLADPGTEAIVPETIVPPIDYLPIYRDGLQCSNCSYVCRSAEVMRRHQRVTHNIRTGRGRRPATGRWSATWCQCFFISVGQRYFPVRQTNQAVSLPGDTTGRLLQLVHRQLDQKERIVKEKRQIVKDSEDATEVSPWLERTQWIRHLEGQDKAAMAQLVKPAQAEEPELQEVEKSLKRLVEKARQTVLQKKVSSFALHRIQSFQPGQDAEKPFHVNMDRGTIERYQRVWSQLLVYILRTVDSEVRLYQVNENQQNCIRGVMLAANRFQLYEPEELEEEDMETMKQEVDRHCLQLCVALLDQQLDHDEYESAIISYLAVAALEYLPGDEGGKYKFKDSAYYTPVLSGVIKIAQMLTIQYCLVQEEEGQVQSCRELLEQLHSRFLAVSTATPMDWVLRLRLYGRGIGRRMTVEGCINWIGETVIYQDIELSMSDFRRLVHKLYEEAQGILLADLLFVENAGKHT